MVAQTGSAVMGRDGELAALRLFVESLPDGPAGCVLEGAPGIGKTTLWGQALGFAREHSVSVLAASPGEAETPLSFAALSDLMEGVLAGRLASLPDPQRHALEVALLLAAPTGPPPDQRAVAAACLSLLRALAADGPVLLAVDDVQWLDTSSAAVLRFAVRRLRGEPVGVLLTQRHEQRDRTPLALEQELSAERLHRIRVGPLSPRALHHLLRERLGVVLPRPALLRIHEASGGNPFFALELGRSLEAADRLRVPGAPLPFPTALDELVRGRLNTLPPDARELLAAGAALSQPTVSTLDAAWGGGVVGLLQAAVAAEIVTIADERLAFAHPLLASAAYEAADPLQRRRIHRRLAAVVTDVEERARHLALAAGGADAETAELLDEAVGRARARGATAAAAERAEQALLLTPAEATGAALRRRITAAGLHFEAGDAARAGALLEEAVAEAPRGARRAQGLAGLARAHALGADLRVAADLYRQALAESDDDPAVSADAEGGLAVTLMRMLVDLPEAALHARAGVRLAERCGDERTLGELLGDLGLIEALRGEPEAIMLVEEATRYSGGAGERDRSWHFLRAQGPSFMAGVVALWHDDFVTGRRRLEAARRLAVELGDDGSLPLILRYLSSLEWLAGRWGEALRLADEGHDAAVQTGQPSQQAVLAGMRALVSAHRGDAAHARRAGEEALGLADRTGAAFGKLLGGSALGFLELSLGNAAAADTFLAPLVDHAEAAGIREPGAVRFVPDEVEALLALDRVPEAEALLTRYERRAETLARGTALAAAARCRGLLAMASGDLDTASSALERALTLHERTPVPFERARTVLALGVTLRRSKQKRGPRAMLEEARAVFEQLGATVWAERARRELDRIGGRPPSDGGLTPTERRLAELVAEGRSNKEVATALFLSPKTVETQLTRIYRKLGVRSRSELAHRRAGEHARRPGQGGAA